MGAVRRRILTCCICIALACGGAGAQTDPAIRVDVEPTEATVGDRLELRIEVDLPGGATLQPDPLGPELGPFAVIDGGWNVPTTEGEGSRWSWSGRLSSFRTGEQTIPSIRVTVVDASGGRIQVESEPLAVSIVSVLEAEEDPESASRIADLKPPASIPPDYGALRLAGGIFLLLLLGAALLWWLHRRYAARLAAVPAPEDPFRRVPPHVWAYAELQKLLERRLAEEGQVVPFFAELSRILKVYLGGRYRVDLLERTTTEVPELLRQAGADAGAIDAVRTLLDRADLVKFARLMPGADECRDRIEQAYRIVDGTKPAEQPSAEDAPREGAA